jgi:hypothetical protein
VLRPRWQVAGYVLCVPSILGSVLEGWEPFAVTKLNSIGLPLTEGHVGQLPLLLLVSGAASVFFAYRRFPSPSDKDVASGRF